jgi:hypothetical protein
MRGLASSNEDEDIVHAPWRHGEPREQGSRSGSCGWITSFLGSTTVPQSQRPSGPWLLESLEILSVTVRLGLACRPNLAGWMRVARTPDYLECYRGKSATMPACC